MKKAVFERGIIAIVVLICLMLPVFAASRCASLERRIDEGNENISVLMDRINGRTAQIAQSSTPEFLVWSSGNLGLNLVKVEPDQNYYVKEEM